MFHKNYKRNVSQDSGVCNESHCHSKTMIFVVLLITLIAFIAFKFYKASKNHAQYFEDRHLKYTSAFYAVRALIITFLGKNDVLQMSDRLYNKFPNER